VRAGVSVVAAKAREVAKTRIYEDCPAIIGIDKGSPYVRKTRASCLSWVVCKVHM
jgi:hypothetical protein